MKKKAVYISVITVALLVMVVLFAGGNRQRKIEKFVLNNQTELEEIAQSFLYNEPLTDTYQDVNVDGVFSGDDTIVQFFYSGFGIAPASKYYGFYYSEKNEPAVYQNAKEYLRQTGEQEWTWTDGTDNGGRTTRITDHWFYYEAWF